MESIIRGSRRARGSRRLLTTLGAPIAIGLVVALAFVGFSLATSSSTARPDVSNLRYVPDAKAELAGIPSHGATLGYADAPVTIHEYADLRCPACREWDTNVLPDVLRTLVRTHRARLTFDVWPILGPNSIDAARAAHAATRQDRLWLYALIAYMNQGDETQSWFDGAFARAAAAAAGLDPARFDRDVDDVDASSRAIARVAGEASRAGFQGTPTFVVVGPGGTQPFDAGRIPDAAGLAEAVSAAAR
jgi:protein-disulfide isomerase